MSARRLELLRRPMARVTAVSLFTREIRIGLSSAAIDLIFRNPEIISEGQFAGLSYSGSTMLTWSAEAVSSQISDELDCATLENLAGLLKTDDRFHQRARDLARREADRIARHALERPMVDVTTRVQGKQLFVDLNIEAKRLKVRAL